MRHMNYDGPGCPVEACTGVITGKWKGEILHWLLDGSKRQGDLHRLIPGATKQELAGQLRELEAAGIVQSRVVEDMPRRVEYSLTAEGKTLKRSSRRRGCGAVRFWKVTWRSPVLQTTDQCGISNNKSKRNKSMSNLAKQFHDLHTLS